MFRHGMMVIAIFGFIVHPVLAQFIAPPSGQGTSSPQGAQTPQSLPSPLNGSAPITPGGAEFRGRPLEQTTDPKRLEQRDGLPGRELPEQPEQPLR
jgi:hypothetical protein